MGYQNFYATRNTNQLTALDTSIEVDTPPTTITSGRMTLEPTSAANREIIKFTGVTGNTLTGVSRGQGGTTAKPHVAKSVMEMNITAEDLDEALAVPNELVTRFDEIVADHVVSGLVWTDDTGLTADMSAGVAYINGIRLSISAVSNRAFTASKDTYIDLGDNGVLDYNEVSNNATPPTLAASHLRLAKVVTNATDTTSILLYDNGSSLVKDDGWRYGQLPAQSGTITYNGNRSYTVPFASDVSSILTPGMRLEFIKNVAGNAYLGGLFNGSSQYFTKVTPSGTLGTVTNSFTIEAYVQPTSYTQGFVCGRGEATANNGLGIRMEATGQITILVYNGGGANYRTVSTYQSLPFHKKTHVAVTWSSGTVAIYFDGISVQVTAAVTGGTAPTTAGTGGDWSIGAWGSFATQRFAGYISNVAVFNAVLSAATIKQHATYKLTGSETNCIGAWSLDNTANDQNAAGNNLTATGGVGYTASSPHDKLQSTDTGKAIGLVMSVATTTVTVQVPEGCTIPTTGGIASVQYSTQANPYNWVLGNLRWELKTIFRVQSIGVSPANGVWANAPGHQIVLPVGAWNDFGYRCVVACTGSGGISSMFSTLSTGTTTVDQDYTIHSYAMANGINAGHSAQNNIINSAATAYYLNLMQDGSTSALVLNGTQGTTVLSAIPSGL